jgi:signal transduction histidine kinase
MVFLGKFIVTTAFLMLFLSTGYAEVFAEQDSLDREIIGIYHPQTKKQVELAMIQKRVRIARMKNPQEALRLNKEFTEKCIEAEEFDYAASGYNETGYMYQEWKMYYLAIEYFLKAFKMYNDHGLASKNGYILVGIGNCYFHTENLAAAIEYYRKAEKQFILEKNVYGTAVAENNMGLSMQRMGNQDSALWFFNLALDKRKGLNRPPLLGHSYYYLGTVKEAQGDTVLARKYYLLAIGLLMGGDRNIYLNYDFLSTMADCYTGLGNIFLLQKRYGDAFASYKNALRICDTIRGRVKVPPIYLAAGEALSGLGKKKESLELFRIALKVSDSAKLPMDQRKCYEAIMKYFLDSGQLDSAFSCFNRYTVLTDSIYAQMMDSRRNEIDITLKKSEVEQQAAAKESRDRLTAIFLAITGFLILLLAVGIFLYIRRQRINAKLAAAEISARKKAEQELEKVNMDLKESNADKDRFISILSHDLRGPFNSILGFADLLVEETADMNMPEIKNYSRMLQQMSRRTFQLLENLLAWSRLQMNNLPFQPSSLELFYQVSLAIDTMIVQASKKSVSLYNLTTPGLTVQSDANMLQAILRNLIANAIKFTRNGGSVEVHSFRMEGCIKVSIKDNGVGIPAALIDKLFSGSGETVSSPGTDNEPGNGLGLVLCHHMVVKNGGKIWIESTSVAGTVISFTVPVT